MANSIEEKYTEFEFNKLIYRFAFDPLTDDPKEGATLTSVSTKDGQSLAPSEFAEDESWVIANKKFGLE